MIWLYALLLAVIAAAFVGMLWLRRKADEAWRAHRMRVLTRPMADAFLRFQIDFVDRVTPALQQVGREVQKMQADIERMGPRIQRAMREGLADVEDYWKGRG